VTVHGRRLADTLEVDFGAVPGRNVRSISATSLVVTSPPGAGTVVVRVVAQAGTSSTTPAGRFTYMARTGAPRPSTAT
jgi:hypothetical protein